MDCDLYAYFGLSDACSVHEIKKAYRRKAKELHPDKNKEDPKAKEKFQQLKDYYDLLHDPKTKHEYDIKWKAKREAAKRTMQMDAERRKMKEALEAREAASQALRKRHNEAITKEVVANQIRNEWQKYTDEVNYNSMKKQKMKAEKEKINKLSTDGALIKVSWDHKFNLQASACYTESFIRTCLSQFGEILSMVVQQNNGIALVEFASFSDATRAIDESLTNSIGLPDVPLRLSRLNKSTKSQLPVDGNSFEEETQLNNHEPVNTKFDSFEMDILKRMENFGS